MEKANMVHHPSGSGDSIPQASIMVSSDAAQDDEFVALLKKLALYKYFPGKMTRDDVLGLVDEELDDRKIDKQEDLCRFFLYRLFSCNYKARDLETVTNQASNITDFRQRRSIYPGSTCTALSAISELFGSPGADSIPDGFFPSSRPTPSNTIHPLDVVVAVYLCSDPILKQDIASLLWECKLAIPFITSIHVHDTPTAHVWPLKSITARWSRKKDGPVEEDSVVCLPFLNIGFIRFQSDSVEKSSTINTLMSDTERAHPIFYHRNSTGSTKRRVCSDGMVEITWYLPNGSGDNMCRKPVTVLNMRGNAVKYPRQLQILMEMVSIFFIVCPASDITNKDNQRILESIQRLGKRIIIVTYDDKKTKGRSVIRLEDNFLILNTEALTNAELKENIRSVLKEWEANESITQTSIEHISWEGISLDQNEKKIKDGLFLADMIMKSLSQEEMECRKIKLLPLQQELWRNWVETEIEIQRLTKIPKSRDITEYRNQKEMEKVNIRREQAKILQNGVSDAILHFLKLLSIQEKVTRTVCVRWLKIQLDKLSRKELMYFVAKETSIKDQIKAMADINQEEMKRLQIKLEKLHETKNKSHLRIEHFFRELGQIYEVIQAQKPGERYNLRYDLPQLAATFLLDGNPLEIFDADVGSIPITWISAIFESLSRLVTGPDERKNPTCTVLTAYGMQSSGKSTLLNTMFGCRFAVSAGRCTRGVQIQMLKVTNNESDSRKVDYILLVDTEGVRSPEITEELRRRRDNEITTFIVGLGQKTLINLMGENTSYLTEVLPIAVRAFLRMKDVGLHPSCAIVYQNVDSQSRGELSNQNRKLEEELNNYTHSACLMEKKEKKSFHDVIQFDFEKDVHYVPSLWEGEKPMAPVSQGYIKSASKLKNTFKEFCEQCESQDLSSYSLHVSSLWRAITKDDFVYFFRNTLETEAREFIDKIWCELVWKLRLEANKCESKMYTDIMNCPDPSKLEETCFSSQDKMSKAITASHENLKTTMKDFFKHAPQKYKQYMCQWEDSSIDELYKIKDDLIKDLTLEIANLQLLKSKIFMVGSKVNSFKEKIKKDVVGFLKTETKKLNTFQGNLSSRDEMMGLFEAKWNGWMGEVKTLCDNHEQKSNITRNALDILIEKFPSQKAQIIEKWGPVLPGARHEVKIQPSHLLKSQKDVTDKILTDVQTIVDKSIEDVKKRLNELTRKPSPYKKGSLEEIVQTVSGREKEIEALGVKLMKDFEIDLAIAAVSIAVTALSENEKKFHHYFDPVRLLGKEKKNFLILFETNYEKTSNALSFVRRVSEVLINIIQHEITQNIAREIADDMRSRVYMGVLNNKKSFLYTTLCQMAADGIFGQFMDYIRNPTKIIETSLGRYVDEYSTADGASPSKLRILLDRLALVYMKDLRTYVKKTETQMSAKLSLTKGMDGSNDVKLKYWIKSFVQTASSKFMVNEIRSLSDMFGGETVDLKYFSSELLNQLKTAKPQFDNITNVRNLEYEEMKAGVLDILRRLVVGCTDACPFCGEICISSQPNHRGMHETPVHRPQGCNGYKSDGQRVLAIQSCQKLVASEFEFTPSRTSETWVPYKNYQTIHTRWKIPGDPNPLTSTFWEWFMITYIKDLEKEHRGRAPNLPDVWKTYSKADEIEKLKKEMTK